MKLTPWLVAAALAAGACSKPAAEETESEALVPVKVEEATIGSLRGVLHATGVVNPAPEGELIVIAPEAGRIMGSAVAEIRSNLDKMKLPIGYTYEIGGQYQAQQQSFRELLMVFAFATVLVFTILVIQFNAWTPAILILLAAPLSLGGALLLLVLTDTDLNISSAMGLILLVGLVVKNGIMSTFNHLTEAPYASRAPTHDPACTPRTAGAASNGWRSPRP